jgi:Winged helix DNA-binding domain
MGRGAGQRVLTTRELNRALLERHFLLRRRRIAPLRAIERLVGLQAQVPRDPYVALWSRLDPFRPETLSAAMESRTALRMTLFRATLHAVPTDDAVRLRGLLQPVVERMVWGQRAYQQAVEGLEVDEVVRLFTGLMEERPRTRAELARAARDRWPGRPGALLSRTIYLEPVVQNTPRGLWGRSGPAAFTTVRAWLGRDVDPRPSVDGLVLRYLRTFGPAAPADVQSWSGLTGMREVLDRLRPRLRTFRDERGRELFDVPRAPLPDPDTPAPVRFLPEFDNVLLGHADRSRIVAEGTPQWRGLGWGTVLVDGFTAAWWRLEPGAKGQARVLVEPSRRLSKASRADVVAEGERLASFLQPEASRRHVRLRSAPR